MRVNQVKKAAKREQWKQRIVECRSSGMPVKEWCKQQGICYSTYYHYEHELLNDVPENTNKLISAEIPQALPVPFVEVPAACQAKSKDNNRVVISISAPGLKMKVTGEVAAKVLKQIEQVLCNA